LMLFFSFVFVLLLSSTSSKAQLNEHDRVAEYHARNYTWPPPDDEFVPKTDGWRNIMRRRLAQVERVGTSHERYNGFMSTLHTSLICPNFTEYGWGLTKAPQELVDELRNQLHKGLSTAKEESLTQCIEADERPLMVPTGKTNRRALQELKPIHEAWIGGGIELVGNNAYGLRVYRNQSNLNMHIDKTESHIISSILHVDHDEDSEPWPIVIEDFHGNTNEVVLESGDMLLYESSKCLHGRPRKFNGSWYSSLFIHYYPVGWKGDASKDMKMSTHYRVPPSWATPKKPDKDVVPLTVIDTSVKEMDCDNTWCSLEGSLRWKGPAPGYGKVLTGGGRIDVLPGIGTETPPDRSEL